MQNSIRLHNGKPYFLDVQTTGGRFKCYTLVSGGAANNHSDLYSAYTENSFKLVFVNANTPEELYSSYPELFI